jgi:CubicO group peptidase (beta-lactamase class C family)
MHANEFPATGLVAAVLLLAGCAATPPAPSIDPRAAQFEARAEEIRRELRIPGMSAVILENQKVVWAKGFGYADDESRISATPDTLYPIASETKPIAATIAMQLVEQGKLDLDEPMSHYSADFKDDSVRVKHILSHTSEGVPGSKYAYSGQRYEYLTAVIEKRTGKSFREAMEQAILGPLGMSSTVPGPMALEEPRYAALRASYSQPYTLYGDNEIVRVGYPVRFFGASAGLLSTVMDMAKFDAAIDRHQLLKKETQQKAWTPFVSNSFERLPYGLGWFTVDYEGERVVWHGGNWGVGFSAMYVKVPAKNVTLIMLSNSEALNGHLYAEGREDVANNAFACAFFRFFVFEPGRTLQCAGKSRAAVAKFRADRRAYALEPVDVDARLLDRYAGEYRFEFDTTMVIKVTSEGGKLYVDVPRDQQTRMFAASPSEFFLKIRPARIRFLTRGGSVNRLEWLEHGETLPANRIK